VFTSPKDRGFQNGQNKAQFPGSLGKSIVEEKEVENVVEDEDEQDNALKHQCPFSPVDEPIEMANAVGAATPVHGVLLTRDPLYDTEKMERC
jgi:hypothetical protein